MQERPLPGSSRSRLIIIAIQVVLLGTVVWGLLRLRYSSAFMPLKLSLLVLAVCIGAGYFFYHRRRRCPECGNRLPVRRDYIQGTQRFRLLMDCPHCQITWNTGLIGDDSGAG